jgi:hypothetical protein
MQLFDTFTDSFTCSEDLFIVVGNAELVSYMTIRKGMISVSKAYKGFWLWGQSVVMFIQSQQTK